ncbi:hypothetical protein P171DRAFT_521486 [Karstenula rhodostoma CBS 690.94]|uniref:RING-type E3 ubiquitin transferase n=1 Tax=Karstenula rhodostoma CBS 690.94 TaxID=1392251 RepID=A0A9P4UBG2_9PLEO|nr:hypothetical protein P171DRAFT_521486 [Karstenula rhodostoma CBS 690.94]
MTFTMSRLQMYIASSAVLANIVLVRAFAERPNFYSAAVYISQSTGSILFLANLALIVMGSVGYGLQRLFYGTLRPIETEQLYDKAWFAVSETLLAMTIFRDDIGLWFFAMFLCLLAGKVWQWIGEGRVEFLEQQPPPNPKLFHARLMSSLVLSVGYDLFMVFYCVDSVLADARAGVMVMFGFEYVLLAIASISTLLRYGLSLVELAITHRQEQARDEAHRVAREQARQRREAAEAAGEPVAEEEDEDDDDDVPGWEEKGRWVFFLDLMTDAIKSIVYMVFFFLLLTFYGIPIHIVRDLFMTLRSFVKRLHDFYQYRNATRDMNARYPDATAEELERENTCIVCREEMQPWVEPGADATQPGRRRMDERQRAKKLPCGHILHFNCLRSWLERQQVCPTCRRSVLAQPTNPTNPQNQANAGQINPAALPGGDPLRGLLGNMQPPAAPAQPGQYHPAPQAGQQNQPQGNVRVFNLGPLRIALGNLRLPANRPADGNANANNNLLMERLAQQIAQQPNLLQPQQQVQQVQHQGIPQLPNAFTSLPLGGVPHHPSDIQGDILRIQQNILASLQQLQVQHHQLENIHALLAELNRLQQASGAAAAGQDLPPIASLNPQPILPNNPQAYFANGPVLRQGDAGVPEGLSLPEGWTLRPMALSPHSGSTETPMSTEPGLTGTARRYFPAVQRSSAPVPASSSSPPTSSNATAAPSSTTAVPSEPSSLGSSWSFDNAGNNEAEGTSSTVAGSSSEAHGSNQVRAHPSVAGSSVPRPVTVEETEDE